MPAEGDNYLARWFEGGLFYMPEIEHERGSADT